MNKFICPIPWMSLSFDAKSIPRLCCHQEGDLEKSLEADYLNLTHLKNIRDEMEAGIVPSQCQGCFQLEEKGCSSPRQDYINRFGKTDNTQVRYLDITFNNDCNLECIMCSPVYSYKLNKVYNKEFGFPVEKSWEFELDETLLKGILPTLEVITLTGGEPFVSKKTRNFIDFLSSSEFAHKITLRVFTNLSHINHSIILNLQKFLKVELILSIDSVGENYELIRYPASWKQLVRNIQFLNENRFPHLDIHLHAVLMSTNWIYIGELIEFYSIHLNYPNTLPLFVEISSPSFLHPGILPDDQFNLGRANIEKKLIALGEKVNITEKNNFLALLEKIGSKRNTNLFLQYKVFLSKLIEVRRGKK